MSSIKGTNIVAPVVPLDTADVYPTHEAKYGRGGYRTAATTAERDAISAERREAGMLVHTASDGKTWKLSADLSSWTEFASASSDPRWALFLPAAPSNVVAVAGDARAVLNWSQPNSLLDIPIASYAIQYRAGSGTWQTFAVQQSSSRFATVTGLANGVSYNFRVKAISAIGESEFSDASNSVSPTAATPISQNRVLIHFDGNGSTFTDSSGMNHALTAFGQVTQSAATSVFGGKSGLFSGGYVSIDSIDFAAYDFVVEMFFKTTTVVPYTAIASRSVGYFDQGAWIILLNNSGAGSGDVAMYVSDYSTSSPILTSSQFSKNDGGWHHVAVVRSGSDFAMYLDGARVASNVFGGAIGLSTGTVEIGTDKTYGNREFIGSIDEVRIISGGNGGYSGASIVVPTSAFS
jgi:Concanavalin A-like lectin/glucanases superfamily/Fibronectin type III domain